MPPSKKRNRSGTSSESTPKNLKRVRQGAGSGEGIPASYKEAAESHLRTAIIDKDNPYGKISGEREALIKKKLTEELDSILLSPSASGSKPPTFRSWTYSGEIIRVVCEDESTLAWLTEAVCGLKPWENATLAVVRADRLPRLTKASLWIPLEADTAHGEREIVLRRLAAQNPALNISKWCLFHHEAKQDPKGHILIFGIGDEDMKALRLKAMRLNYMFTSLALRAKPGKSGDVGPDSEGEPPNSEPAQDRMETEAGGAEQIATPSVDEDALLAEDS